MKITKTQSDKFICTKPDLAIITFDDIFREVVIHGNNIIYNTYGDLTEIKKLNSDVRKIFTYTILKHIYDRMITERDLNSILLITTNFTDDASEMWEYIDREKLMNFVIKTCRAISKAIPLPVHIESNNVDLLSTSGETKEVISKLEHSLVRFRNRDISLNKLKKFSVSSGLTSFIDEYHSSSNIKKNLFYYKYLKGVSYE